MQHSRDAVLRRLYSLMPQLRRQALHIGRVKYLDGISILPRLGGILMLCVDTPTRTPTSCGVEGNQFYPATTALWIDSTYFANDGIYSMPKLSRDDANGSSLTTISLVMSPFSQT